MGDGNYEDSWVVMSWGHGMFGAYEVGGPLWKQASLFKECLLLQGYPKFTKIVPQYKTIWKEKYRKLCNESFARALCQGQTLIFL
jgi:hypothetical protein